jgi:CBS domain-containing protein
LAQDFQFMKVKDVKESLDALGGGVSRFVQTSRLDLCVGTMGFGFPFVGCGVGVGFWSPVHVPFVGPLLSSIMHNLALADRSLVGGQLASGMRALTASLPGGMVSGTGCGIGIGYGYGAGLFFKPGALDWMDRREEDRNGRQLERREAAEQSRHLPRDVGVKLPGAPYGRSTLTVADIMRTSDEIITCSPDTPLDDAVELFVANEITGLPVVDAKNRICGMVSDVELLMLNDASEGKTAEQLSPGQDGWNPLHSVQSDAQKSKGLTVSDVMNVNTITVSKDTSVSAAADLLVDARVRGLPVLDADGCLCGLVSRSNIIKASRDSRNKR